MLFFVEDQNQVLATAELLRDWLELGVNIVGFEARQTSDVGVKKLVAITQDRAKEQRRGEMTLPVDADPMQILQTFNNQQTRQAATAYHLLIAYDRATRECLGFESFSPAT